MNMYYLFGQCSVIRMCLPLLDFEDRRSYMSPIEISGFITIQIVYLMLIGFASVYLKYNLVVVMINTIAVCISISIGIIKMLSEEDLPVLA